MSVADEGRAPGMHDVARRAGVSHQTVSRVLNGLPNVRQETKERVTAAIAELGYRRNNAARALVTRRSSMIGVITSGSNLWGPSSALIAVESAARAAGYYVSLAGIGSVDKAFVSGAFDYFTAQAVEGIIVIAPEAALAHAANPLVAAVPVVMVAADTQPSAGLHITSVDQEGGARLAVRHLLELGHRSVAHVCGPPEWFDAAARQRGWRRETEAAGLEQVPPIPGDWTAASGYAAGRLLASGTLPTAVFAANDLMALGVIRAFHDLGIAVPQQVSVVGFDDIPGAAHFIPGLTTIKQDFAALGRQCIDILLSALGGGAEDPAPIPPQLIVRESTAAAGA
jgi:DNA-binding LacI/PurR family transcriptional regulator